MSFNEHVLDCYIFEADILQEIEKKLNTQFKKVDKSENVEEGIYFSVENQLVMN